MRAILTDCSFLFVYAHSHATTGLRPVCVERDRRALRATIAIPSRFALLTPRLSPATNRAILSGLLFFICLRSLTRNDGPAASLRRTRSAHFARSDRYSVALRAPYESRLPCHTFKTSVFCSFWLKSGRFYFTSRNITQIYGIFCDIKNKSP